MSQIQHTVQLSDMQMECPFTKADLHAMIQISLLDQSMRQDKSVSGRIILAP